MQRTGRNRNGYAGEALDVPRFGREFADTAGSGGWREEVFLDADGIRLAAWRRSAIRPRWRVYLSAGIHGDEPAGPLALLELFRESQWPDDTELVVCPLLNPAGASLNRRENRDGLDLNLQYLNPHAAEVRAHVGWLQAQGTFDMAICLHEDWEAQGFYLYELNPDGLLPGLAAEVIRAVSTVCPIDHSPEIDGRAANGGVIRPPDDPRSRSEWPEAFYLFTRHTRLSYTFEAPSDFPMETRVAATAAAVRTALLPRG
jgi:murein peptide amidase A